jgi:uncharacterized membrane protein YoaK (UPF0700 family)
MPDTPPTPNDDALARRRWLALVSVRLAGAVGAVFGLVLIGRAEALGPKLLGVLIVLSALFMIATVPRALARRWRTAPED